MCNTDTEQKRETILSIDQNYNMNSTETCSCLCVQTINNCVCSIEHICECRIDYENKTYTE